MQQTTTLRWGDGYLFVEPSFPDVLLKKLRYWRRALDWSEEQMRRIATGKYEELYSTKTWIDQATQQYNQQLLTMPGFLHRVKTELTTAGWGYTIIDERTPFPKPNLERACQGLYDHQVECACIAVLSGGGLISCATGWGKTRIIKAIINAFDPLELKARGTPLVVVSTPDKDITAKDWRDLKGMLPDRDVGLVMSGHNQFSDDIQVITLDSLHRLNPDDVGLVIVDEVHSAASDTRADNLLGFRKAARWGVSATPTGRFDGRDLVTEGLFGPIVYTRSYAQGVADGALVPITVYWVECPEPSIGMEKFEKYTSRAGRYGHGVIKNKNRNALIGQIMQRTPKEMQTLAIMQYLNHMNNVLPYCGPGTEIVHAETSSDELARCNNLHAVTIKERKAIYQRMESGELKRILSTHVYKQGVNFPNLAVVVNVGGGGSDIVAKQIPGRESRKTETKACSFLIDFWHPWDKVEGKNKRLVPGPVHSDDIAREKAYTHLEFEQIWIKDLSQLPFLTPQTAEAQA